MALTAKQERFCNEYLIDLNGKQAAIRAGFSAKTAMEQASRLLSNVKVSERIQELQQKRQKRTDITADKVIIELAKIAFFDIRKIFDDNGNLISPHDLEDEVACAIASIKTRIEKSGPDKEDWAEIKEYRANDKLRALEMLARHFGIFAKENDDPSDNNTKTKYVGFVSMSEEKKKQILKENGRD